MEDFTVSLSVCVFLFWSINGKTPSNKSPSAGTHTRQTQNESFEHLWTLSLYVNLFENTFFIGQFTVNYLFLNNYKSFFWYPLACNETLEEEMYRDVCTVPLQRCSQARDFLLK